jgi:hypothetical protein
MRDIEAQGRYCSLQMRGAPRSGDYRGLSFGTYSEHTARWCWLQTGDSSWLTCGNGKNPLLSGKRHSD